MVENSKGISYTKAQTIYSKTPEGHEIILSDPHGKIQITTSDKMIQIVLDTHTGDLQISNINGKIKIFATDNIELHTPKKIIMNADDGIELNSSSSTVSTSDITSGGGPAHIPNNIAPTHNILL